MTTAISSLKIVRILDVASLTPEAIEYFDKFENGASVVDADRARNFEWTDEIVNNTVDYGIADEQGNILASGFKSVADAEAKRAGAKVTFALELEPEPVAVEPTSAADHDVPLSSLVGDWRQD